MNCEKLKVKRFQVIRMAARFIRVIFYLSLFTFHFSLIAASAQDDPPDLAPPPLKVVSSAELERLNLETDLKTRTKLALQMMTIRLNEAEKLNSIQDFEGMFRELGGFHGLMDNAIEYLQKRDSGSNKVLDNFKRIEIGLRGFAPRLEAIRRDVPLRFEDYVRKLLKYVREARTKAAESLFGDTVIKVKSDR